METIQIPSVIIGSEFPDRDKIKVISEWKPDEVHGDLEVYHASAYDIITIEIPTDLFSYDEKTRTLSHLTFPEFYLCNDHGDILYWYFSKEGEDDHEAVKNRYQFFMDYFCRENLMSDAFRFCTNLKYLGYYDWHKYPHPIKFYFSYSYETLDCVCRFDPTKYLVRRSEKYADRLELVDLKDNSVFFRQTVDCRRHAFNHRYLLCL